MAGAALGVQRSRAFGGLVRAGFAARALTYGIIGVLAVALAAGAGSGGGTANQQGALSLIAHAPLGRIVVIAAAAGLLAYALWKLGLAIFGTGPEGGGGRHLKDRVANFAGGLVYVAFFAAAVRVLVSRPGNETTEQRQAAAGVMAWPGGRIIVAAIGVGLILVSLFQIYEALCDKFADENKLRDMSHLSARTFHILGHIGLSARALVFLLVGYFFVRTSIEYRASDGIGIDGALAAVHRQPLGALMLAVVAAGLLTFSAFSLFEARYRRL